MQLGTPMTIMSGGMSDISRLTRKSNNAMLPNDHVTPTATTAKHTPTTARLRKNSISNSAVTKIAAPMKYPISPLTLLVMLMRMNGKPLKCVSMPWVSDHRSDTSMMSSTMVPRWAEFSIPWLNTTIIKVASLSGLYRSPS